MFKSIICCFTVVFCLLSSNIFAEECKNDERLKKLPKILKEIKDSEDGTIEEPLTMTGTTYYNFSDKIKKILGDNVMICPDNFIVNGEPIYKIEVDAKELLDQAETHIRNEEYKKVKEMKGKYKAKPIEPKKALRLASDINLDRETLDDVTSELNLSYYRTDKQYQDFIRFDVLQLLDYLGGTIDGDFKIGLHANDESKVDNDEYYPFNIKRQTNDRSEEDNYVFWSLYEEVLGSLGFTVKKFD
ncbi:MAG: hypothetical protein ACOCQQ_01750 [Candidatus Nanoarchaeia archaeon]